MTQKDIEASLAHYLITNLTGETVNLNQPDNLDPDRDDVTRFLEFNVTVAKGVPSRRDTYDYIVSVEATANSRSQTDQYDATKLLDRVIGFLRQKTVAVHDYEADGEPIVGYVYFQEDNAGQAFASGVEQWQVRTMQITGHARNA